MKSIKLFLTKIKTSKNILKSEKYSFLMCILKFIFADKSIMYSSKIEVDYKIDFQTNQFLFLLVLIQNF